MKGLALLKGQAFLESLAKLVDEVCLGGGQLVFLEIQRS